MRIIAGKYRGRRLAPVRGDVRPTSDRLRETLFNVIGERVIGSTWIDLFAGSGAVGIEALSRGARFVLFSDTSRAAIRLLKRNLEMCGVEEGFQIREQDAFAVLRGMKPGFADVIFCDPPYDFGRYEKLLRRMVDFGNLGPHTIVVIETFKKSIFQAPEQFETLRDLVSGDAHLAFLRLKSAGEEVSLGPTS
jgi:16S rRNA (guanine966-N2)-methyltransferase